MFVAPMVTANEGLLPTPEPVRDAWRETVGVECPLWSNDAGTGIDAGDSLDEALVVELGVHPACFHAGDPADWFRVAVPYWHGVRVDVDAYLLQRVDVAIFDCADPVTPLASVTNVGFVREKVGKEGAVDLCIRVTAAENSSPMDYDLELSVIAPSCRPGDDGGSGRDVSASAPLEVGPEGLAGCVGASDDEDTYEVQVREGEQVTVRIDVDGDVCRTTDVNVRLSSEGTRLDDDWGVCTAQFTWIAPADRGVEIQVWTGAASPLAGYAVRITTAPAGPESPVCGSPDDVGSGRDAPDIPSLAIAVGPGRWEGCLAGWSYFDEIDSYRAAVAADEVLTLDVEELSGGSIYLRLFTGATWVYPSLADLPLTFAPGVDAEMRLSIRGSQPARYAFTLGTTDLPALAVEGVAGPDQIWFQAGRCPQGPVFTGFPAGTLHVLRANGPEEFLPDTAAASVLGTCDAAGNLYGYMIDGASAGLGIIRSDGTTQRLTDGLAGAYLRPDGRLGVVSVNGVGHGNSLLTCGTGQTTLLPDLQAGSYATDVAADGTAYILGINGQLIEVDPSSGALRLVADLGGTTYGLALDGAGGAIVSTYGTGLITHVDLATGESTPYAHGTDGFGSLLWDGRDLIVGGARDGLNVSSYGVIRNARATDPPALAAPCDVPIAELRVASVEFHGITPASDAAEGIGVNEGSRRVAVTIGELRGVDVHDQLHVYVWERARNCVWPTGLKCTGWHFVDSATLHGIAGGSEATVTVDVPLLAKDASGNPRVGLGDRQYWVNLARDSILLEPTPGDNSVYIDDATVYKGPGVDID